MRLTRRRQDGDTIIEVMFAVAVFAMVAVGCISIMNQGTATAQRSLEMTLVREQIEGQAETIRYIHQAYIHSYQAGEVIDETKNPLAYEWVTITDDLGASQASPYGQLATIDNRQVCLEEAPGEHPFVLDPRTASILSKAPAMMPPDGTAPPFAEVYYGADGKSAASSYGLWVEAVPSSPSQVVGFVDFHIRACWETVGSPVPATLGTIVRLYEPRS